MGRKGGMPMQSIRQLRINQVKENMVLAEDVYTENNEFVLPCNTVLNASIVERLKQYNIYRINVYEDEDHDIIQEEVQEEQKEREVITRKEEIRSSVDFQQFKQEFDCTVKELKKTFGKMLENEENDGIIQLTKQIDEIRKNGHGTLHVMEMLNCMREYDDVTFAHSISVSLLCRLIGEWMQLPESELQILSTCGLLHDIGKLQIPNEIISKPGKLTNEEFKKVQEHPALGYYLLKERELDERVKMAALMHHERCDGKGYPMHVESTRITDYSKIVMIADVYDAMTADRSYRAGMCPFKALEIMEEDGLQKYDPYVLMLFMEKTAQAYINSTVLLSDQSVGEIISINKNCISRPLVRVGAQFIDLSKRKDLEIISIL